MKKITTLLICSIVILLTFYKISKSTTFQFFGEIHDRVETSQKLVALTYDDGPAWPQRADGNGSSLEINNTLINSSGGWDNFFGLHAGADTRTDISNSELRGDDYALNSEGGSGRLRFVYLNGVLTGDASNTMRARCATRCGVLSARSHACSVKTTAPIRMDTRVANRVMS